LLVNARVGVCYLQTKESQKRKVRWIGLQRGRRETRRGLFHKNKQRVASGVSFDLKNVQYVNISRVDKGTREGDTAVIND
jgi:ribosomal protein L18E